MLSPALRGEGVVWKAASFAALCAALCSCNATAPLTASLLGSLPRPAQAGGLALWNTLANIGGYFGPAVFGWLKVATGGNAAGMAVRPGQCSTARCAQIEMFLMCWGCFPYFRYKNPAGSFDNRSLCSIVRQQCRIHSLEHFLDLLPKPSPMCCDACTRRRPTISYAYPHGTPLT